MRKSVLILAIFGGLALTAEAGEYYPLPTLNVAPVPIEIPATARAVLQTPQGINESDPIHLDWSGEAVYGNERETFTLDLTIIPGPSVGIRGQVITTFVGVNGTFETSAEKWVLEQENVGVHFAKAHVHDTGHLGLFLPIKARSGGVEVFFTLAARCSIDAPSRCEDMTFSFDVLRLKHQPQALHPAMLFGWTPKRLSVPKGEIPDCCIGGYLCCCHEDCSSGGCVSTCGVCSVGGCDACKNFIGCGSCTGPGCS